MRYESDRGQYTANPGGDGPGGRPQAGRREGSVQLLAATKMNDAQRVREAVAAGVDACGENRVQELQEKLPQGAYEGAPLHFIGHLQKNKAKFLVGSVDLIQSVDSEALLQTIDRLAAQRGLRQDILLETISAARPPKAAYRRRKRTNFRQKWWNIPIFACVAL